MLTSVSGWASGIDIVGRRGGPTSVPYGRGGGPTSVPYARNELSPTIVKPLSTGNVPKAPKTFSPIGNS